ncbi:MAG: RNase adapter RapZ [Oscillospiraceae bacterium]|nr:RNase adapter RapZ [Oscillospiraceae bacterium]
MELLIISGLSGAGKSRVAALLEDMDYYCVDNMPVAMMPKFAELINSARGRYERVAMVTDVRATRNVGELFDALGGMRDMGSEYRILFVEADVATIVKRYKETRRRHPLEAAEGLLLENAVKREISLLSPLREQADDVIDTTGLTLGNLQRRLFSQFMQGQDSKAIGVSVKSFGFKHGLPIEADLVFDVRFLPNPYYVSGLHSKSGMDEDVKSYVFSFEQTVMFMDKLREMMDFLLPYYIEEGKRYLVICVGCTGGRHRSVAVAQALAEHLSGAGYEVDCIHRDIDKNN